MCSGFRLSFSSPRASILFDSKIGPTDGLLQAYARQISVWLYGDAVLRFTILIVAMVELTVVAFFVAARDEDWESEWASAMASDPSLMQIQREVWAGGMPAGARNPQLGRISGRDGIDFVVGHDIPRVKGQDPSGRLRVYVNSGARTSLSFRNGFWLDEKIPSARIPVG